MKTKILITLCLALSFCVEVYAEGEQEVKRGMFPFMAFIYYPDETVVDGSGARFLRGAVLIQPDWLVTSAVGPSILANGPNGFPRKTLLARVGAITIDSNFTLNEDEDEQEREVIQIVRPYNHSATQWWQTDISLMKTLLPFNMTTAVAVATLVNRQDYVEKTCTILVYAKRYGNLTEDRNLMQLSVDLLPPSVANCGPNFLGKAMTCASDSEENKNAAYDPAFCQGNSGGPLICEGDVIGIQTYIDNDCKQPHLYQMLSAWDNFISCGTEDKCHEEQCSKICDVATKDPPPEQDTGETSAPSDASNDVTTVAVPTMSEPDSSQEITSESESQPLMRTALTEEQTTFDQTFPDTTTMSEQVTTEPSKEPETSTVEETSETKWPKEKDPDSRKKLELGNLESTNRNTKVEAQQEDVKVKKHNAGHSNVLNHSFFFGYFILACLI